MTTAGKSPKVWARRHLVWRRRARPNTESDDPLISDPFARVFLDRVGDGEWDWYGAPELPAEVVEAEPALPVRMKSMVSYFASRTKFFDTFFLDAANCGHPSGGDPGGRPGRAMLAVAVARRGDGLRARPAQGVGLQSLDIARGRVRSDL